MNPVQPEATTPHADPEAEILPLLRERWSPSTFSDRPISPEILRSVFEAARWAPSSYNEQPWAYIVARKEDEETYRRALSCLVEANQAWAQHCPVLLLACYRTHFARNGKPNRHAAHDLGAAAAHLTFQATAHGFFVHQMAGIDPEKIRQSFEIPDDYEPLTALALGYLETAPGPDRADTVERDQQPDQRRRLADTFFTGTWGTPHPVAQ
ncbi:nitroreductase [Haloferula luteola]|uniref:Nitroreductase n=1 Tax=Haloferula luteola TaxID=595692 RepID=A0A840VG53_9BACT|nr:nitroreductase family protein [Haloferula luteola]MBB5353578.1 nitroreductase [Haloferula luteola]